MLKVEYVLLGPRLGVEPAPRRGPAWRDATWLAVLDAFWPLSMLGMFIIGIKVAFAGRRRGVARIGPLIAETWVVAVAPFFILVGQHVSDIVAPSHLIIGYSALGVILAARPHLTGAR